MSAIQKKPLVLIVDDERFMRHVLRDALEKGGYTVLEAESGLDALSILHQSLPDIVLLDVIMPVMDGFSTCMEIRADPLSQHLPVLMITGLEDKQTIEQAYAVGATDYIVKPINDTHLRHHIRYLLHSARLFEKLRHKEESLAHAQRIARLGNWQWLPEEDIWSGSEEAIRIFDFPASAQSPSLAMLMERVHPEDRKQFGSAIKRVLRTRQSAQFDHRLLLAHGTECHVHSQIEEDLDTGKRRRLLGTVQDITDRKRNEENERQLKYLASYDSLTDLPNRQMFQERLTQAISFAKAGEEVVGVLFANLNNFKEINALGTDAGDQALKQFARRYQKCVWHCDTAARIGGDQFAIILRHISCPEHCSLVAQRIIDALAEPFILGGEEVFLSLRLGISLFPDDGQTAETLIKNSEAAMHFGRQQGQNGYCFYSEKMNSQTRERLSLKTELRRGLDRDEFLLYYQPKFDSRTTRLTGMEALVRWQHPERGLVPPLSFIPLAEETGLIMPLGEKVLRMACRQVRHWQEMGFLPPPIAVNLSAVQFRQPNLIHEVAGILQETGMAPAELELEITESAIIEDTENAARTLRKLKDMGIRIALDDFGTGFSSLGYLKRFPVDCLKIDYSFVKNILRNPQDTAIVRAIIAIARSLNLTVIAEGVETEEQRAFLIEHGCDEIQGYLAGMPKPPADLVRFLQYPYAMAAVSATTDTPIVSPSICESMKDRADPRGCREILLPFEGKRRELVKGRILQGKRKPTDCPT